MRTEEQLSLDLDSAIVALHSLKQKNSEQNNMLSTQTKLAESYSRNLKVALDELEALKKSQTHAQMSYDQLVHGTL